MFKHPRHICPDRFNGNVEIVLKHASDFNIIDCAALSLLQLHEVYLEESSYLE